MNRVFANLFSLTVAACFATGALLARDTHAVAVPPVINPVDVGFGGLQTSLTTGGFRFVIADFPAMPPVAGAAVVVPDTFPACASLQNRSPFDIDFTFPTPAAADLKFTFRIFDSAGTLVWQSDTNVVTPQLVTDAALGKFQRWKRTLQIPLKPGGKALAAGIYTLEASIDADKQVGASAVFEVIAAPTPPDPTKTGIKGLVLKAESLPVDGQPAPTESPAAGALIVISPVATTATTTVTPTGAAFSWSGRTDDLGQFTGNVPAGHYRVTANYVVPVAAGAIPPFLVYPPKTVEVEVVDQQFASVTIHLVPVGPPPPPVQGINGRVLEPNPVANAPGQPPEIPAVGAKVTIDQITDATAVAPFHWQGVSGPDGAFSVQTPPGKYKVTASVAALPPTPGGRTMGSVVTANIGVTVNVTVTAGQFATVALHIGAPVAAAR